MERAKEVERTTHVVQRSTAVLNGPIFAQLTTLTWMHDAKAGYSGLPHTAACLGVQVSRQAIEQRMSWASVALMREVWEAGVGDLISSEPTSVDLLSGFAGVSLQDGTIISLPDCLHEQWPAGGRQGQQAGMRVQVRVQMQTGAVAGMWVPASQPAERSGDAVSPALPCGSLLLADTGYFTLPEMRERTQAGQFFLTQAKASVRVRDEPGVWRDLLSFVREHADTDIDKQVVMGKREQGAVRLIAVRVNGEQAEKRRARAVAGITHPPKGAQARRVGERQSKEQRHGKQKRKKVSATRLQLSDWTLLVTNVPQEQMSVEEALVLARYRWQIEWYWKLWKQEGKVDTWQSSKAERIWTEVFAQLIGLLITHWMTLIGCWSSPTRSMMKAKQVSEWMTPGLALALAGLVSMEVVQQRTAQMMRGSGCQVNTRRRRPNAGQLIQCPKLIRA